jgi:protein TonB
MNLEVEGTKLPLSDATQSTTFSLKITAPPSYAGVFRVGGAWGASVPRCPKPAVEPNYTDAARSARVNGSVKTDSVVNKDGSVSVINFVQKLGYGLDEAAKKFVEKNFKCKPGTLQGQPVATWVKIDINFHLYR